MLPTEKQIKEFQEIYKKEYGKELSYKEASEAAYNLISFVELLYEIGLKEAKRKRKLKENPKGFHLTDDTYTCCICHDSITGDNTWYDKNGIKCLNCQRALDKKKIPAKVCHDRDSWYAMWELNSEFNIKYQTAQKMIREGKLKARIITNKDNKPHCYIFIKKENPILEERSKVKQNIK